MTDPKVVAVPEAAHAISWLHLGKRIAHARLLAFDDGGIKGAVRVLAGRYSPREYAILFDVGSCRSAPYRDPAINRQPGSAKDLVKAMNAMDRLHRPFRLDELLPGAEAQVDDHWQNIRMVADALLLRPNTLAMTRSWRSRSASRYGDRPRSPDPSGGRTDGDQGAAPDRTQRRGAALAAPDGRRLPSVGALGISGGTILGLGGASFASTLIGLRRGESRYFSASSFSRK
jgi:hypothetical protein